MTKREIMDFMKAAIARETKIPINQMGEEVSFFELGFDSISVIHLLDQLEKKLNREINPIWFYDYPTLGALASFLETLTSENG